MSAGCNTPEQAPRVVGRPFQKGVSGNPGGKSKATARAEKAMRRLLPDAIEQVRNLLASEDPHLILEAAKLVFKYTLSVPVEKKDAKVSVSMVPQLKPEVAAALAALDS
jgi:hypothetical protein